MFVSGSMLCHCPKVTTVPYKDPEKQKAAQAAIYQKNKDHYREKQRAWRAKNKEKKKEQDRRYRETHREQENARKLAWARANRHRPCVKRDKAYMKSRPGRWEKKLEYEKAEKYVDRWGKLALARFTLNELSRTLREVEKGERHGSKKNNKKGDAESDRSYKAEIERRKHAERVMGNISSRKKRGGRLKVRKLDRNAK